MTVVDALEKRRSVKHFDPNYILTDNELHQLFEPVMLTPSSFNLQHWRFIVVRDKALQKQLCEASYGQTQVRDCSATVIIAANLHAHLDPSTLWRGSPSEIAGKISATIEGFYSAKPDLQRDEALRSGGLSAMTLMLVAAELGLATCPMIGFDPDKVAQAMEIPADHLCVMMICVGKVSKTPRPRATRYPVNEEVRLDGFRGAPLIKTD